MTKYLVFNHDSQNPAHLEPGSNEAVACEIVAALRADEIGGDRFQALPERSKAAKEWATRQRPLYSVDIEAKGKIAWQGAAFEIIQACRALDAAVSESNNLLLKAEARFKQACKKSKYFEDLDGVYDLHLSSAFDDLHGSCEMRFMDRVIDAYLVNRLPG